MHMRKPWPLLGEACGRRRGHCTHCPDAPSHQKHASPSHLLPPAHALAQALPAHPVRCGGPTCPGAMAAPRAAPEELIAANRMLPNQLMTWTVDEAVEWQHQVNLLAPSSRFQHSAGLDPCLSWIRGECRRSNRCHFRHSMSLLQGNQTRVLLSAQERPRRRRGAEAATLEAAGPQEGAQRERASYRSRSPRSLRRQVLRVVGNMVDATETELDEAATPAEDALVLPPPERNPGRLVQHAERLAVVLESVLATLREELQSRERREQAILQAAQP